MSDLLDIFQKIIGRQPDRRELEYINTLSQNLPGSVLNDVGMMAEIAIRASHIRQLEIVLDRAGDIARTKAEIDGERYAINAANKIWRKVLDQLPVDSVTTLRRYVTVISILSALTLFAGSILGWSLREYRYEAAWKSSQAATEVEFSRCLDAAEGRAQSDDSKGLRYSAETFSNEARTCAAEYADRRAGGG